MWWRGGLVWLVATIGAVVAGGCGMSERGGAGKPREARVERVTLSPQEVQTLKAASGQVVYVPIYSHVYFSDGGRSLNLTALLSIRNTDRRAPIVIKRVDYHGSDGKLLRSELKGAVRLAPLAVTEVVLPERDMTGGSGASFLVEWVAEQEVSEPVIEGVMIGTMGSQGISFVSPGRVLEP
jgi:hypothetical protein